jgi:PGF-CTERM protein
MDADGDGVYDIENISVDDGAILYQGQDIMFDSGTDDDNANSQYVLYRDRGTDTQDSVETILAANTNGGNFTFDTADLDTGADYYITNDGRNNPDFNFSLVAQSYSVEFDEDSIDDQGEDVATFLEVTADNRPGAEMPIRIDSEGLDDNDLEMIFDEWADNSNYRAVSAPEIDADDDDDTDDEEDGIIVIAQDEDEVTANFSDIDAGEYNFTTTVMDTEVDDDASITVNDVGDGEIGLDQSTVNTAQGDIATVTVTLSQASSGNLVIGDEEDSGYQANVGFSDEDDDGEVTIGFNTYTAGTSSEDTVFAVTDDEGDDDTVTFNAATGETNLTEIIATSDYGLAVRADGDYETTLSSPDTVGTLYVNERTTGNQTVWTAPSGADFNPDDEDGITSEDVATLVEEGTVTQDTTIAAVGSGADYNIHELSASGLGGVFEAIEVDNSNDPDLEGGDIDFADINGNGLNLTIEQTDESKAANAPAKVVDIQDSGTGAFDFVQDRENGNYYLIVDMSAVDLDRGEVVDDDDASTPEEQKNVQLADDDEFESEISIDANRLFEPQLDSDDESMNEIEEVDDDVTATFTTVDREVDFDQDPVQVGAASEQTITGTTSLAASSELTVRLKSTDDTQPRFVKTNDEVIAQPDGTWSVTFDFAEQSAGDTFDATVQKGSNPSTTVDGEVVEAVETTEQTTEQTAEQTTEQTAEQTTESETTESETTESETTASETTGESSPGFGIAVAVVALLAAALLAYRRD